MRPWTRVAAFIGVVFCGVAGMAVPPSKVVSLRTFDPCPGLESIAEPHGDGDWLPLTTETVRSESPESWAGPAAGHCGPVDYRVTLDHVRRLSGKTFLDVRVVAYAEAPFLVLGLGWPTVVHAEDESGAQLEAPRPAEPNHVRFKVRDSAGTLDASVSFPLDRGPFRSNLKPVQLRRFRATIPAVVVNGFRTMVRIADPIRDDVEPITRHGMTVTVSDAQRAGHSHRGEIRITAGTQQSSDLWKAFSGVPIALIDSAGRVVFKRWVQLPVSGNSWVSSLDFESTGEHVPPYTLVVYEPNAVTVELPLEWARADVPPLRVEAEPVPP